MSSALSTACITCLCDIKVIGVALEASVMNENGLKIRRKFNSNREDNCDFRKKWILEPTWSHSSSKLLNKTWPQVLANFKSLPKCVIVFGRTVSFSCVDRILKTRFNCSSALHSELLKLNLLESNREDGFENTYMKYVEPSPLEANTR